MDEMERLTHIDHKGDCAVKIDISKIVNAKLEQMERIEEVLEKTILDAITSELSSYSFKRAFADQISGTVGGIAADCGLAAYNGFIAERVKAIVQDVCSADIAQKTQTALDGVLLKKHENIKLSDIFRAYRDWVLTHTDEEDKYERQEFTSLLEEKESGSFTYYTCTFADRPLDDICGHHEPGDVVIRLCAYGREEKAPISSIWLDNRDMSRSLRIGIFSEFEAFAANLYYNRTEIILDADDVDADCCFDVDC